MNKKIIFLILIFTIIVYFQYKFINTFNTELEITQFKNPEKGIFEKMINEKTISIFTDIKLHNPNNIVINKSEYDTNKLKINKLLRTNLSYYDIPLCVKSSYDLKFKNAESVDLLLKQTRYRRLIYMISGTKRIVIFNKSQEKYLYMKKNISNVNFWVQDLKKYPLLNKSKYVEIILRENMMISLPYGCMFTTINETPTTYVDIYSESLFSNFLKS